MFVTNQYFVEGFTIATNGGDVRNCPLLFEGTPRALWLCGFQYGSLLHKPNPDELVRVEKSPFEQGHLAFAKGQMLDDNPYGFGDPNGSEEEKAQNKIHHAWRLGWLKDCKQMAAAKPAEANPEKRFAELIKQIDEIDKRSVADVEDFSNYPVTLGEKRSQVKNGAGKWKPRDALIAALRDLDSGKIKPDFCIIVTVEQRDDDQDHFEAYQSIPGTLVGLGMLDMAMSYLRGDM